MKKEIKIVIAVVVAIWIFVMGMEVGIYRERKAAKDSAGNTTVPVITTTAPTTTAPTTATPTTTAVPTSNNEPEVLPTGDAQADATTGAAPSEGPVVPTDSNADPSSLSKEEVLEKAKSAVNQLKAEQNMTAVQKENITVELTALSVEAAKNIVNSIISGIVGDGPSEVTYTFANGQAADPENNQVTPMQVIPPVNKEFSLTADGVASATAAKQGTDTVYTIVLVAESTTLESPEPLHNAACIGYLNLAGIDVSPAEITKADMHYPGSTVTVTVNADGKVIGLKNELPMTGEGEAKVIGLSGSATFEGGLNEEWAITY